MVAWKPKIRKLSKGVIRIRRKKPASGAAPVAWNNGSTTPSVIDTRIAILSPAPRRVQINRLGMVFMIIPQTGISHIALHILA